MANEKRLIDALGLVIKLAKKVGIMVRNGKPQAEIYSKVLECIAEAPTVDAVEVVRCKDCTEGMFAKNSKGNLFKYGNCNKYDLCVKTDHFCSYGERKEGG